MKKWTEKEIAKHVNINVKDYGAIVVVDALYKKLYGHHLEGVGLSGAQAGCADSIVSQLPNKIILTKKDVIGI